jgi:hypothetical protein
MCLKIGVLFIGGAGRVLDTLPEAGSIVFGADDSTVLYTVGDSSGRPCKVHFASSMHHPFTPAQTMQCLLGNSEIYACMHAR